MSSALSVDQVFKLVMMYSPAIAWKCKSRQLRTTWIQGITIPRNLSGLLAARRQGLAEQDTLPRPQIRHHSLRPNPWSMKEGLLLSGC